MSCFARLPALALAALATLGVAGCAGGAIGANTPASSGQSFVSGTYSSSLFRAGSRPAAPDISGTTLTGQHLSLSAYRGSVVVLNFWGSWCAPCRAEAPDLTALATDLRPARGPLPRRRHPRRPGQRGRVHQGLRHPLPEPQRSR